MADGKRLTRHLAQASSTLDGSAIPADVRRLACTSLLDLIGVTLAGSVEPLSGFVADECEDAAGAAQATLLGRRTRLPMLQAALANGVAAHALDYDDVSLALSGHPGASIWPAVLALGEYVDATGQDAVTAYIAGYELACRLGRLMMPESQGLGFHLTGTVGIFGAAAACSRLLRLDAETTAHALGIAGAQAAGLRIDGGTMAKPLHAGRAAQGGLLAARLAARGFTARPDVIEAERGFAAAFRGGSAIDAGRMDPANEFHLRDNIFKLHAACFFTHAAIDCAIAARADKAIEPEQVAEMRLCVHPATLAACDNPHPVDGLQAKRSFPQTVAMALLSMDMADPDSYGSRTIGDPAASDLRGKVMISTSPAISETGAEMTVALADGQTISLHRDAARPEPMTKSREARLLAKFTALAARVVGGERAAEVARIVRSIDLAENIGTAMRLCATDDARSRPSAARP